MNVRELLGKRMLFFDGGMCSMLQKNGMGAGEIPELLNLTNAALIEKIHTDTINTKSFHNRRHNLDVTARKRFIAFVKRHCTENRE